MKISVIAAMDSELAALKAAGIDATPSGIGKVNAAMTATRLILESHPDMIINTGCAGGMAPKLKVGDFVIGTEAAYHDVWCGEGNSLGQVEGCPKVFAADADMVAAARKVVATSEAPENFHFGQIASGDQFFISLDEDRRILSVCPEALAADMESAAIAQVCHKYGVRFLSIRVISDIHVSEHEQKRTYEDFWANVSDQSFRFVKQLIETI